MPTSKHRIAAYLPPEVDEKFQAFKQERGVGDSQALILILIEFLEVSHQVNQGSSLYVKALKGELLSELLGELDTKFNELKSELLSKSLETEINNDLLVSHELVEHLTIAQLSKRFGCDAALVRKQKSKYRDEPEKFITWSKSRDPDGRSWQFDETAKLFTPVSG